MPAHKYSINIDVRDVSNAYIFNESRCAWSMVDRKNTMAGYMEFLACRNSVWWHFQESLTRFKYVGAGSECDRI